MTEKEWDEALIRADAHLAELREKLRRELNWDRQERHWKFMWASAWIFASSAGLFALARFLPEILMAWDVYRQSNGSGS